MSARISSRPSSSKRMADEFEPPDIGLVDPPIPAGTGETVVIPGSRN